MHIGTTTVSMILLKFEIGENQKFKIVGWLCIAWAKLMGCHIVAVFVHARIMTAWCCDKSTEIH
jgi:hypothetical protein